MTEHKRPGGLTALAVLNFVFAGFGVIGVLAVYAMVALASAVVGSVSAAAAEMGADAAEVPSMAMIWVSLLLGIVSVILLIASGVGYLGLKKFLGYTLGNAYAAVSIIGTILNLAVLGTGFGIGTIIGLVYPVLTLVLLNTTFKEDFVN